MKKLKAKKNDFSKAIFSNLEITKLLNNRKVKSLTISKSNSIIKYHIKSYDIFIIIVSKTLMELISSSSGGTSNIIKIIPKEIKNKNIAISETKTLFGKISVITPNINRKTKLIINTIKTQKENPKKTNEKIKLIQKNSTSKKSKEIIKPLKVKNINIQKPIKNEKNPIKTKKDKTKKTIKKAQNKPKTSKPNNNFKPKYKLQKVKTQKRVALFTSFSASILFGIALAALSFKKIIKGMIVVSVAAILNFKKLKKTNKKLVKKI